MSLESRAGGQNYTEGGGMSPELKNLVPEFLIFRKVLRVVGSKHVSLGG